MFSEDTNFHPLKVDSSIELPKKFTFPFYYEPHSLSIQATKEVQNYLEHQFQHLHNFGLGANEDKMVIGKMFGVLVVQNEQGEIGYLTAFSGKLADSNEINGFVPPVFDILKEDGFYRKGEAKLFEMTAEIEEKENAADYLQAKANLAKIKKEKEEDLVLLRAQIIQNRKDRKALRISEKEKLSETAYSELLNRLKYESIQEKFLLRDKRNDWDKKIAVCFEIEDRMTSFLLSLKQKRKALSSDLQRKIHEHYQFLNAKGETKHLLDIFPVVPPAGAGECAAPKLLQYAYSNQLTPISMAEFWWGAPPKSEIRKHKQFYPSCRGKCEPILGHMLKGLSVDENPMLSNPGVGKELEIIYEDEYLVVVHKPHDLLSVPGKTIKDCVQTRLEKRANGRYAPLLVHRLDMATSGVMIAGKNNEIHKLLQQQFIERSVKKRYIALLDGVISLENGEVDLPLRVDLNDRPRQVVCYEYGKPARTIYEVIEVKNQKTKVAFYPVTGRTHQLRMHSAHSAGLNTPIVGDDLYGTRASRLHLHAELLELMHPISKKRMKFRVKAEF